MQYFVGTQKNRLSKTLVFCVFKRIYFVRLGPSVRLEENNNFFIQYYLQNKLLLAQSTERSLINV